MCYVLFLCYGDHRDLHVLAHSFPTRPTSNLIGARRISLNDTPSLEAPDPRPARRFGEPDRFAQLRKGLASVLFQRGNDFPVESVHILCLGWIGVSSPPLCMHGPRNATRPMPFVLLESKFMPTSRTLLQLRRTSFLK